MENRLLNRKTYCEWDKVLVGPILDEKGLEQGGCSSSDSYKLYNNELLTTNQKSEQGVDIGNGLVISAVGQADDTGLISNDIFNLRNLLHLTLNYCTKYNVELCPEKTKLLLLSSNLGAQEDVNFNPIKINGTKIDFVNSAEHVGIIRSVDGNTPNTMNRIVAHKKALGAVIPCGIGRSHRANPASALRVLQLYGVPVLMSGVASLVLSKAELNVFEQHYKETVQNLQKLLPLTPASVIFFLGGTLPATALHHLKQLALFGMVNRLRTILLTCMLDMH